MQSKIIILLLFILSFSITHDMILNTIDTHPSHLVSDYVDTQNQVANSMDIHDMHSMFHFVGLSILDFPEELLLGLQSIVSHYQKMYSAMYFQWDNKPPIV